MMTVQKVRAQDRISAFLDKAELRELVDTYARAIDRRDMSLLRSCYCADAIDNHGAMFSGTVDEYISWQPKIMAGFENSAHYILNAIFQIEGDEAEGEVYFIGAHRIIDPEPMHEFLGGRYMDHYRRDDDGRWKFAQRDLAWDWYERRPLKADDLSFVRSLGDYQGQGSGDHSQQILKRISALEGNR